MNCKDATQKAIEWSRNGSTVVVVEDCRGYEVYDIFPQYPHDNYLEGYDPTKAIAAYCFGELMTIF